MGEELIQYGPWGILASIVMLLWREAMVAKNAPKSDRAMDAALSKMAEQFIENMVLFKETNKALDATNGHLDRIHDALNQIRNDLARGGK